MVFSSTSITDTLYRCTKCAGRGVPLVKGFRCVTRVADCSPCWSHAGRETFFWPTARNETQASVCLCFGIRLHTAVQPCRPQQPASNRAAPAATSVLLYTCTLMHSAQHSMPCRKLAQGPSQSNPIPVKREAAACSGATAGTAACIRHLHCHAPSARHATAARRHTLPKRLPNSGNSCPERYGRLVSPDHIRCMFRNGYDQVLPGKALCQSSTGDAAQSQERPTAAHPARNHTGTCAHTHSCAPDFRLIINQYT